MPLDSAFTLCAVSSHNGSVNYYRAVWFYFVEPKWPAKLTDNAPHGFLIYGFLKGKVIGQNKAVLRWKSPRSNQKWKGQYYGELNHRLQLCFEIGDQHLGDVIVIKNNDFKIKLKSHVAFSVKTASTPFVPLFKWIIMICWQ